MEERTPMQRAECGCLFGMVADSFVLEACSIECWLIDVVNVESAKLCRPVFSTLI